MSEISVSLVQFGVFCTSRIHISSAVCVRPWWSIGSRHSEHVNLLSLRLQITFISKPEQQAECQVHKEKNMYVSQADVVPVLEPSSCFVLNKLCTYHVFISELKQDAGVSTDSCMTKPAGEAFLQKTIHKMEDAPFYVESERLD